MPNHVTNILTFSGEEKEIKKLLKTIKGEDFEDGTTCLIDFHKIIPFPEELKGTRSPTKIVTQKEYDEWMRKYNIDGAFYLIAFFNKTGAHFNRYN